MEGKWNGNGNWKDVGIKEDEKKIEGNWEKDERRWKANGKMERWK